MIGQSSTCRVASLIMALAVSGAWAAAPNAIDAPKSARSGDAQRTLDAANGQYKQAVASARADYKAKQADCNRLADDQKKSCLGEAAATRKQALTEARKSLNKATTDVYSKAPELRPDSRPIPSQPETQP